MNIVTYGGGTNSTALIIELIRRKEPIDLILFADTGGETPKTYEYIEMFSKWIQEKGYPEITVLQYIDQNGNVLTLEEDVLKRECFPPPCYGFKSCSEKFKIRVCDKYIKKQPECIAIWERGEKVFKFVGYDAGEERRKDGAAKYDVLDNLFIKRYPLIDDWNWDREKCKEVIKSAGLSLPGKSSCFFCPNMKAHEILTLSKENPDLFERALEIERRGLKTATDIRGLGRNFSWKELVEADKNQVKMCIIFDEKDMPCGCYDG